MHAAPVRMPSRFAREGRHSHGGTMNPSIQATRADARRVSRHVADTCAYVAELRRRNGGGRGTREGGGPAEVWSNTNVTSPSAPPVAGASVASGFLPRASRRPRSQRRAPCREERQQSRALRLRTESHYAQVRTTTAGRRSAEASRVLSGNSGMGQCLRAP